MYDIRSTHERTVHVYAMRNTDYTETSGTPCRLFFISEKKDKLLFAMLVDDHLQCECLWLKSKPHKWAFKQNVNVRCELKDTQVGDWWEKRDVYISLTQYL